MPSFSYGFIVFRRNLPKEDEAILGKFIGMLERDKKKLEEQNIRFEFRENESGMIEVIEEFESNNGSKYVRKQIQERKKEKKYNEKD